jgi:dihydrofolate reductase
MSSDIARAYEALTQFLYRAPIGLVQTSLDGTIEMINPMAASLNATQKYVVSNTLTEASWAPTTVISSDVAASVGALKAEGEGAIVVLGSGRLARFLLAAGLVDGLTLFIHPLLLGTGTRLFGDLPDLRRLHLESSNTSAQGSLVLNYRFA